MQLVSWGRPFKADPRASNCPCPILLWTWSDFQSRLVTSEFKMMSYMNFRSPIFHQLRAYIRHLRSSNSIARLCFLFIASDRLLIWQSLFLISQWTHWSSYHHICLNLRLCDQAPSATLIRVDTDKASTLDSFDRVLSVTANLVSVPCFFTRTLSFTSRSGCALQLWWV